MSSKLREDFEDRAAEKRRRTLDDGGITQESALQWINAKDLEHATYSKQPAPPEYLNGTQGYMWVRGGYTVVLIPTDQVKFGVIRCKIKEDLGYVEIGGKNICNVDLINRRIAAINAFKDTSELRIAARFPKVSSFMMNKEKDVAVQSMELMGNDLSCVDNDVVFTYLQGALVELWEAYDNGVAVINLDVKGQNMAEKGNRWMFIDVDEVAVVSFGDRKKGLTPYNEGGLATANVRGRVLRDIYTPGGRPRFFGLGVLPFDPLLLATTTPDEHARLGALFTMVRIAMEFRQLLPGDYPDKVYHVHHFYDEESEVEHGEYELIDHLIHEIKDEKMVSILNKVKSQYKLILSKRPDMPIKPTMLGRF